MIFRASPNLRPKSPKNSADPWHLWTSVAQGVPLSTWVDPDATETTAAEVPGPEAPQTQHFGCEIWSVSFVKETLSGWWLGGSYPELPGVAHDQPGWIAGGVIEISLLFPSYKWWVGWLAHIVSVITTKQLMFFFSLLNNDHEQKWLFNTLKIAWCSKNS